MMTLVTVIMTTIGKMAQCASLISQVQSPTPARWEERTDS